MELKATIEFNMEDGEKLLVLIANSLQDQDDLYSHLLVNIKKFRENLAFKNAGIEYITAGYWDKNDVIIWQKPFIELNGFSHYHD